MEAQNIMTEIIVKHQTIEQNRDSLELSTPAKGGSIKIYTDFLDKELTEKKILAAIEARKFANIKLNEQ